MEIDNRPVKWLHEPERHEEKNGRIILYTEPGTDFWQNTYYGVRKVNGHALLMDTAEEEFSFSVKTTFASESIYDQCGVMVYLDEENWCKACVEYETEESQKLGSVVTTLGFSDWASADISGKVKRMYYRVSRRGNDYLIENSTDGQNYHQLRMFHLLGGNEKIGIGIFACSPSEKGFKAVFEDFAIGGCVWPRAAEGQEA